MSFSFKYSLSVYSSVERKADRERGEDGGDRTDKDAVNGIPQIESIFLKLRKDIGEHSSDVISVCNAPLMICSNRQGSLPYWVSEDGRDIVVGGPTEEKKAIKISRWNGYEAYPLCGWNSVDGSYSPYGGQCYVAVLSDGKKTVSLEMVLGKNEGCRRIEKCWGADLRRIHRMIETMR